LQFLFLLNNKYQQGPTNLVEINNDIVVENKFKYNLLLQN